MDRLGASLFTRIQFHANPIPGKHTLGKSFPKIFRGRNTPSRPRGQIVPILENQSRSKIILLIRTDSRWDASQPDSREGYNEKSQFTAMEGSNMASQANNSRRLSVNAAFMQDIKNDNRDLKILMDRLAVLTHPREAAANHWSELIQLFSDLNDQLALHFGLEEAYGYFDQALDADPEMSIAAEELRGQHAVLFEDSRHLAEAAAHACTGDAPIEGVTPEVTTAQEKVLVRYDSFVKQFHEHEEAELKLILDALDEDLGVGD